MTVSMYPGVDQERLYPLDPAEPWPRGIARLEESLPLLTEALATVLADERDHPVRESLTPEALGSALELTLQRAPQGLDEVIEHLVRVMRAAPLTSGPRFFNQLFAGRDPAALCGELLAALGNHSVYLSLIHI